MLIENIFIEPFVKYVDIEIARLSPQAILVKSAVTKNIRTFIQGHATVHLLRIHFDCVTGVEITEFY